MENLRSAKMRRRVFSAPPCSSPPSVRANAAAPSSTSVPCDIHWTHLPMELRVMIFGYLKGLKHARVSFVCKAWRSEFFHSRTTVDLSVESVGLIDQEVVSSLVQLAPRTRHFSLNGQKWLWFLFSKTDALLRHITDNLPTLPSINGVYCTITDLSRLQRMAQDLHLEEGLSQPISFIRDSGETLLSEHVPRYLSFVGDCGTLTDNGLERVSSLARGVPASIEQVSESIRDRGLQMSQSLPSVSHMSLQDIKEKSLHHIGHFLPKSLDLASSELVSDHGVKRIAAALPNLRSLDLTMCNVSDVGMHFIATHLPNLRELHVAQCADVTEVGVQHIGQHLPYLRCLDVARCSIGEEGIICIADNLRWLHVLNLDCCSALTDDGLENLCTSLVELEVLVISGCEGITDRGMRHVAQHLKSLEHLDTAHCNLSDVGLLEISHSVGKIARLDLRYCHSITEFGIGHVALRLPLEYLNVEYCYNVGDAALHSIAMHTRTLRSLHIAACTSISEEAVEELQRVLPELTIETELSE